MKISDILIRESGGSPLLGVTVLVTVDDPRALWDAAAERGLAAPGMTLEDIVDVIGPREDPALRECVALLSAPLPIAGCTLEAFEVREAAAAGAIVLALPQPLAAASRH